MRQIQALAQQLQTNHCHDARCARKHASIHDLARPISSLAPARHFEPQGCDAGAEGLADAAEQGGPEHCFPAGIDGQVEGESEGKAFSDVVDEEGEEDGEAEGGVGVVCGVCYKAFGNLVQGDCARGLQADGEEDVCWDVVVVAWFVVVRVAWVVNVGGCGRGGGGGSAVFVEGRRMILLVGGVVVGATIGRGETDGQIVECLWFGTCRD